MEWISSSATIPVSTKETPDSLASGATAQRTSPWIALYGATSTSGGERVSFGAQAEKIMSAAAATAKAVTRAARESMVCTVVMASCRKTRESPLPRQESRGKRLVGVWTDEPEKSKAGERKARVPTQ